MLLKDMNDEQKLHKVISDMKRAVTFRQPFEDKWLNYYRMYRCYVEGRETGANLFIPYTFSVVESVAPRIVSAMFAGRPYIGVLPVNGDSVESAKVMESLLDYQIIQRMNAMYNFIIWVKEALMYGTSIIKVGWKYEERVTKNREPMLEVLGVPLGSRVAERTTVVHDDPAIENIDLWDFYIDPAAKDIDDGEFIIHRFFRDLDYLKKQEKDGIYKNIGEIAKNSRTFGAAQSPLDERLSEIGMSDGNQREDAIEIWEYWTDERLITIANQSTIIRDEENPYWHGKKPFVRLIDMPVPHEFYGIGEIEPIRYLQDELNTTRNQRIDNVTLILNRMWKVLRGSRINPGQLISRPGGFIELDDMNDIQELVFPDVTESAYREEEQIKRDIDNAIGVYDYVRGDTTKRRETATTAHILSSAANERFKLKIKLGEDVGLQRLGHLLIELNLQFIDRERIIRVAGIEGESFPVVTPESIMGEYDVMAIGSSIDPVTNKDMRLNQLISLYNVIKGNPFINEPEFLKCMFDVADIKNTERLIVEPQPQPPEGGGPGMPGAPMMGAGGMPGMGGGIPDEF